MVHRRIVTAAIMALAVGAATAVLDWPQISSIGFAARGASVSLTAGRGTPQSLAMQSDSVAATSSPSGIGYFSTLPTGSALPSDSDCTSRVRHSSWEPRPDNYVANHTTGITGLSVKGASSSWNARYAPRIDGSFTGTTDEILQWGACKWGLDENIQRARAVQESSWRQSTKGDYTTDETLCNSFGQRAPCYQSYGILQVKASDFIGTYPTSERSTPFVVDYSLAWMRACFDGSVSWLGTQPASTRQYTPGDIWGCVGAWYSGNWYDSGAHTYIDKIRHILANQTWLQLGVRQSR